MHFADDWESDDERWRDMFPSEKVEANKDTAKHRCKFAVIEDAYNKRWQVGVKFGR